jgi:hypothetical protein
MKYTFSILASMLLAVSASAQQNVVVNPDAKHQTIEKKRKSEHFLPPSNQNGTQASRSFVIHFNTVTTLLSSPFPPKISFFKKKNGFFAKSSPKLFTKKLFLCIIGRRMLPKGVCFDAIRAKEKERSCGEDPKKT